MDVAPVSSFTAQADNVIDQFISATIKDFAVSFRTVRDTIQANGLLTATQDNARLYVPSNTMHVSTSWMYYNGCSCFQTPKCHSQAATYNGTSWEVLHLVPGFTMGCYIVEALLQSSLECFYSETCFDDLNAFMYLRRSPNVTVMNGSVLSRFSETAKVGELLDEMMVERWNQSVVYANYYSSCSPKECVYLVRTRNDLIYTVPAAMGLIGGLSTVLRILVPRVAALSFLLYKKKRRIDPATPIVNSVVNGHVEDVQVENL